MPYDSPIELQVPQLAVAPSNPQELARRIQEIYDSLIAIAEYIGTSVVPTTRQINTNLPLTGGGDLSVDRTLDINVFGAATDGVVPPSGGGVVNFLRADGAWAIPPGVPIGTNLSYDSATGTVFSDTGTDAVITLVSAANRGLAPASGGGTVNFLRADGNWTAPPGTTNLSWTAATRTIASDTGADAVITLFTNTDAGLTPASGGGTANFLRADGSWALPIPDLDRGDITSSASGATWTIDNNAVTYAKLQDVSATQRVLGRNTAGAGDAEEVTFSQFLDWVGSAAQGDLLYRGGATWARLAAGTARQFLRTAGAGANPVWAFEAAYNQSTAAQGPGFAADTYVTGSSINVNGLIRQGMRYRCRISLSKTAAGVAAAVFSVRFGIAGTTADTARLTFTLGAQTAAVDTGVFEITVTVRTHGAAGIIAGAITVINTLAATGLTTNVKAVQALSGAFDTTVANSIIGISINAGAAAAWTISQVQSDITNLA